MQKNSNHLGLFAKYWEPGKVKTRLASKVGSESAAKLYQIFLQTLSSNLKNSGDLRTIVFDPPEKEFQFVQAFGDNWIFQPQHEGNLGDRLTEFFKQALQIENANVLVIGSDCLEIDEQLIEKAFAALNEFDVVVGPSNDGGYYLIGMSQFTPHIFKDISWSTDSVFAETESRLQAHDTSFAILEPLNDVDELDDLIRLCNRLRSSTARDQPGNKNLLQAIDAVLECVQ